MGKIFISYRRGDSADMAGRIYDRLLHRFGREDVFIDTDSLPIGVEFPESVRKNIAKSDVFLALIGDRWLDIRDDQNQRRLDNAKDYVRQEVEQALGQQGTQIIPVLIKTATMPKEEQLPESIQRLATINALAVRIDPDFNSDMDRLLKTICESMGKHYDPAPSGLAMGARVLAIASTAALASLGGWWIEANVAALDFALVAIAAWPLGFGAGIGVYWLARGISKKRLAQWTLAMTAVCLACLWPFMSTWGRYVLYDDQEKTWFLIADKFQPFMYEPKMGALLKQYTAHPDQAVSGSGFKPESIYDPDALSAIRSWLKMSWLLIAATSMTVVALLIALL